MKREDCCFCSFLFYFISHRKHCTIKGGRGKTKEKFPSDASKSYTFQSLRVKPLEISYSSVIFFSDRDGILLFSEEFVLTEEFFSSLRNSPVPIAYTVRNMIALRILLLKILTVAVLCTSCPKISIHLTVISLKGIYVLSCRAAP